MAKKNPTTLPATNVLVQLLHAVVIGEGDDAELVVPGPKPISVTPELADEIVDAGAGTLVPVEEVAAATVIPPASSAAAASASTPAPDTSDTQLQLDEGK